MRKLSATPNGRPNTPTTFSIIRSATGSAKVCSPDASARKSCSVSSPRSLSAAKRSLMAMRKKLGMREPLAAADLAVMWTLPNDGTPRPDGL